MREKVSVFSHKILVFQRKLCKNFVKLIFLAVKVVLFKILELQLANFLLGEARLESYLEEWPPTEANVNRAKYNLIEAQRNLNLASNPSDLEKEEGVALDAKLLLGKLYYSWGQCEEALKCYDVDKFGQLPKRKLPL